MKNLQGYGTSMTRPNGLLLMILFIVSLVAEGQAQSSSQVVSAVSQVSSQFSSQADSQSPSQTVSQTASPTSESPPSSSTDTPIVYDDSCSPGHKDLINQAFRDAMQQLKVTIESTMDYIDDPAFWHLYGKRSVGNMTAIKNAFRKVYDGQWSIPAICNLDGSAPCDDLTLYGGIAERKADTQRRDDTQSLSPELVFCREFFALPPLDHRVQTGINYPVVFTTRYNLGYFHDNQGESFREIALSCSNPANVG
jgi:hypothetical protein